MLAELIPRPELSKNFSRSRKGHQVIRSRTVLRDISEGSTPLPKENPDDQTPTRRPHRLRRRASVETDSVLSRPRFPRCCRVHGLQRAVAGTVFKVLS